MISAEQASEIIRTPLTADARVTVRIEDVIELTEGWYFPWKMTEEPKLVNGFPINKPIGSNGIIVNKSSARTWSLGSAYPVNRDLKFYDLGYQSERYDVVITAVHDREATVSAMLRVKPMRIEVSYESGTVWRIPKPLNEQEISDCIDEIPSIFRNLQLYFALEEFHGAIEARAFEAVVLGRSKS